jgi:cellulose synthase/poly-beta-1,6-N-acetylglucosamine synthase-like glycosyltransferase
MLSFISYLLAAVVILPAFFVAVFFVEILAAVILPPRQCSSNVGSASRPRLAVLVPAHDESTGVLPTLEDIKAQLQAGDRLLVIADNCTDDTAAVAKAAGALVIERNDPNKIGKGYALDFGLRRLDANPPEIVVMVDADCRLGEGAIGRLAVACALSGRPVQALYLITAPAQSAVNQQVAEFAVRVKNWVRPLGLSTFNLPCQLTGTGMAFPWALIRAADLASGQIVEDLKLGLDLALAGSPPLFCPSAIVTSEFPSSVAGAESQRQRWEHGHVDMIVTEAPRLIKAGITQANFKLLALVIDMAVPPLVLLGLTVIAVVAVGAVAAVLGFSSLALVIAMASLAAFAASLFMAWLKCGTDILPLGALVGSVPYILAKFRRHSRLPARGGSSPWIRTDRKK